MELIWKLSLPLIHALQSMEGWVWPMWAISWLGSESFLLLWVTFLYWCVDARLGVRVALILLLSTSLNSVLKLLFAGPRPQWYDAQVTVYEVESSFGLPSAHAQNAVAVWGETARSPAPRGLGYLAIGLSLLIGISRIYLGVHFPTDVLVGWIVGFWGLWLFNRLSNPVMQRMQGYELGAQLGIAVVTSLLLVLPSLLMARIQGAWELPAAWLQALQTSSDTLPQPLSLEIPIATAGTWLGFVGGILWMSRRQPFQPRGNIWRRGSQYLVGITIAIALWAGLDQLFPEGITLMAYSFRYLRYALLGGWIAAGAPLVFQAMMRSRE